MVEEGHAPRPIRFGKIVLWHRPSLVSAAARMSGAKPDETALFSGLERANEWDSVLK
ncbi:hypothetical protein NBRC3257_1300 [Gluconobacter thailandicus NBRC 3257]|uniref:Uncharacterized protein n=2 Tax=Acetobacteraceae TaxID=433 RepID=A0ABQ0IVR4_GLUTH|nr:hypothetical protein NBRC3255_1383 [Gluconobacter thailandicus NBRC 3255]GAD26301.1 hypothetical protein NBRC3257_1300 [Gluconobacter thailandicus NBRC 3257]